MRGHEISTVGFGQVQLTLCNRKACIHNSPFGLCTLPNPIWSVVKEISGVGLIRRLPSYVKCYSEEVMANENRPSR